MKLSPVETKLIVGLYTDHVVTRIKARLDECLLLEEQLRWTPVTIGLPTTPGTYEFSDGTLLNTKAFELDENLIWNMELGGLGGQAKSPLVWHDYTHFRLLALPALSAANGVRDRVSFVKMTELARLGIGTPNA